METLKITVFGTVLCDNGFEFVLEDFIKALEKNINNDAFSVLYDDKSMTFNITFNGKKYLLLLDSESKKMILECRCNETIHRLINLSNIQQGINNEEDEKKKEEERKNKIIANAKKGIIPDDEAKKIYLEKVENDSKLSSVFKKTNEEQKKLLHKFYKDHTSTDYFFVSIASAALALFFVGAAALIIVHPPGPEGILEYTTAEKLQALKIGLIGAAIPQLYFLTPFAKGFKKLINNLKDYFKNRKLNKHKAKELRKSLNLTKSESIADREFNKTITNIKPTFDYAFKDTIYHEANTLLNRIEYLSDKKEIIRLKTEIRDILRDYRKSLLNIQSNEKELLSFDNLTRLQSIVSKKLLAVELEINGVRSKEISNADAEKEYKIIEERLGPVAIDKAEIDGELERREQNLVFARKKSHGVKHNTMH